MVSRYLNRNSKDLSAMRIAVLCFNRTLVAMLRKKLEAAYKEQTKAIRLPSYPRLHVTSFYRFLKALSKEGKCPDPFEQGITDFSQVSRAFLQEWLEPSRKNQPLFDAVFVDEAQDLTDDDIRLLWHLTKFNSDTGEKNLIIFYDDAQNLYGRSRPNWKELGIDVQRGDRSKVMRQSFRNTKEIINLAFNLLLGKQADSTAAGTRSFADVGYLKQHGLLTEYEDIIDVSFTERRFHLPEVKVFSNREDEIAWLVTDICTLIMEEHVRAQDILLISPYNPLKLGYQTLIDKLVKALPSEHFIGVALPQNTEEKDKPVFRAKHITISTPHSVKGYDADVVYLIGVDYYNLMPSEKYSPAQSRAAFYVGATRAKSLLFLSGIKTQKASLLQEAERYLERFLLRHN